MAIFFPFNTFIAHSFFFLFLGFSLFVGNLNSDKDFEEIKDGLRKFFTKNNVEVTDVRLGSSK